jgi:hypothetical protein
MGAHRFIVRLVVGFFSLALLSCTPRPEYINPEADFAFYQHVGVIPFSNLTGDRTAAEKVTSSFTTELLMHNEIQVVNSGDFFKAVREAIKGERTNYPEEFTSDEALALGKAAHVEGVFVGAVREYGMVRVGSDEFPLVGILVRLFDCQSGKIAWSYEITRRGGPKFPVFSFGETHTMGDMTTKVCREAAGKFAATVK